MGRHLSQLGLVAFGAGLAGLLVLAACSGKGAEHQGSATSDTAAGSLRAGTSRPSVGPIVVLGFDGADPDRVERLWSEGKLPHLKSLAESGSFSRLGTTSPPQSPVAWASFATGTNPGKHGVFDFIARDPSGYRPEMGAVEYRAPRYGAAGELLSGIDGANRRRGTPFWQLVSEAGYAAEVINVPYSWPPEPLPKGGVASGLGTPDLRPTNSTSTVFTTDQGERIRSLGGVRALRPDWDGRRTRLELEGPRGPARRRSTVEVEVELLADGSGGVRLALPEGAVELGPESWSPWQVIRFDLGQSSALAQVRFYLEEASSERLHLYASAIGAAPEEPFVELSHPPSYAEDLVRLSGRYNTVGWEEDTSALNAELLSDRAFAADLLATMDQRRRLTLAKISEGLPPLLISVWTGPDRASHMFWRLTDEQAPRYDSKLAAEFGGLIDETYEQMDRIVGEVRAVLPDDALLLVMSDHGFHGFSKQVHVNRWLVDAGYLKRKPGGTSIQQADWSGTKAYALGTGQIYLNLEGRESEGIVPFGEQEALLGEIEEGLAAIRDGEEVAVTSVSRGGSIYKGGASAGAPDLLIGFASGYQASWSTRLGGVGAEVIEPNLKKWSGDHAASSAAESEGVLFSSRPIAKENPSIEDLGPTILQIILQEFPGGMDGRPLF